MIGFISRIGKPMFRKISKALTLFSFKTSDGKIFKTSDGSILKVNSTSILTNNK